MPENVLRMSVASQRGGHERDPRGLGLGVRRRASSSPVAAPAAAAARRAPRCAGPPAACRSRRGPPDGGRTGCVPSPKRMKRHCGDTVRASVTPLSPRKIHSKSAPFSTIASKRPKATPAWIAPSTVRDPSVTTTHQPEQRRERREVARVVHVLLVDAQHGAAEPGDEPGDGEGDRAGLGRPRCRSTARPARCPAGPAGSARPCPARIWITATDAIDEDDRATSTRKARSSAKSHGPITGRGTRVPWSSDVLAAADPARTSP